jgi:hypothetical protein
MVFAEGYGEEVLRVGRTEDVPRLDDWIHDAYLEDNLKFSAEESRVVVPFAQESGWGSRHASMADPVLVKRTLLARHYEVPLTRCYLVVQKAQSLDYKVDWGNPTLVCARFDPKQMVLELDFGISISVAELDVRVFVSADEARRLHRKVLRGFPAESDRWIGTE